MIIAMDVDGVVADTQPAWLEMYNREYGDNKTMLDWTSWNIHEKLKCGKDFYKYLKQDDFYGYVNPIEGAKEAIDELRKQGNRVVYVSASVIGNMDNKVRWLQEHGFVEESKGHPKDVILTSDKDLVRAHVLIDDGPHNIEAWPTLGIVFDAPYNHDIRRKHYRMHGWSELPKVWEAIYG